MNADRHGIRLGPRHPRLAAAGFRAALPLLERFYASRQIFRSTSRFAAERLRAVRVALDRGETVYLGGIGAAGLHNSGVALIELSREHGPRILCNNEEERFSGKKHSTDFPRHAIDALAPTMKRAGIGPEQIAAWLATWDYPAFAATIFLFYSIIIDYIITARFQQLLGRQRAPEEGHVVVVGVGSVGYRTVEELRRAHAPVVRPGAMDRRSGHGGS